MCVYKACVTIKKNHYSFDMRDQLEGLIQTRTFENDNFFITTFAKKRNIVAAKQYQRHP